MPAERRDLELPAKLREEAGQIMAWCVEGAVEWSRRGLDVPASVTAASKECLDGEDTLGQFLADETVMAQARPGLHRPSALPRVTQVTHLSMSPVSRAYAHAPTHIRPIWASASPASPSPFCPCPEVREWATE
jgi:hypothetical protein